MENLQKIVNEILREHGIIDNGASQTIAATVEFHLKEIIRSQIQSVVFVHQLVGGMLSNSAYDDSTYDDLIDIGTGLSRDIVNTVVAGKTEDEHTH